MPTVIATHDVKDTAHWLSSPKRAKTFGTIGVTNIRTFVNPQNRNNVGLALDVPDLDAMTALLESDEGKAAEEYDGVLAEFIAIFIEGVGLRVPSGTNSKEGRAGHPQSGPRGIEVGPKPLHAGTRPLGNCGKISG